jgi:hypothetical protein
MASYNISYKDSFESSAAGHLKFTLHTNYQLKIMIGRNPEDAGLSPILDKFVFVQLELKAVDTIGICQRLAFTVCVSQHMHKITNL